MGIILIVILVIVAVLVENWLASNPAPADIKILKSDIPENGVLFVDVKALDTRIIAVKTEESDTFRYNFAFDDCEGCYQQFGKRSSYKMSEDKTAITCKTCGHGCAFEEMGFVTEDCSPVYIDINDQDIIENESEFIFTADYLTQRKVELDEKRAGAVMIK